MVESGKYATLYELADVERIRRSCVRRVLRRATRPDMTDAFCRRAEWCARCALRRFNARPDPIGSRKPAPSIASPDFSPMGTG
jgi:hypothetical protein